MSEKIPTKQLAGEGATLVALDRGASAPRWNPVDDVTKLERSKSPLARQVSLRPIISSSKELMATDLSAAGFVPEGAILEDVEGGVYGRFSKGRKRGIIGMVAMTSIITPFSSAIFFPAIPIMATDLSTTGTALNITVAVYLVVMGLTPLIWAPMSTFYGRRPVYLASIPLFVLGSVGVALSQNYAQLMGTRILQAFGASSGLAIGAGTIGDCFHPLVRGRAMGWMLATITSGPAIAPVIAGLFDEYVHITWRGAQWFTAAYGLAACLILFFFLPETMYARPCEIERKRLNDLDGGNRKFVLHVFNPLKCVALLRYPNILAVSCNSSLSLASFYGLLVPLSYTMAPRYNLTNGAIIGLLYLPFGLGNMAGARVVGVIADRITAKWQIKRGHRVPEDRLRAGLISNLAILPGSILIVGWTIEYGVGGIETPLIFMFVAGVGMVWAISPSNTYCVDVMQSRSSEVLAINNCIRYCFAAGISAACLPVIEAIGIGWTNTIFAGMALSAGCLALLTIRYGESWRERTDGKPVSDVESS